MSVIFPSSSTVQSFFYNTKEQRLYVKFKTGEKYWYDVPYDSYEAMKDAPSKGRFVWNHLRGRQQGYVVDNPGKKTPGGVGGSLVGYGKGTSVSPRERIKAIKKLRKEFRT